MSSGTREKKQQQPLVRIDFSDKILLDKLSERTGESSPRLLHRAIVMLKKQIFFDQLNQGYQQISQDSRLSEIEKKERDLFEESVADGLGSSS